VTNLSDQLAQGESSARRRDLTAHESLMREHQRKLYSQFERLARAARQRLSKHRVAGQQEPLFTELPNEGFSVLQGSKRLEVTLDPSTSTVDYEVRSPHPELGTRRAVQGVTWLPNDGPEAEQLSEELLDDFFKAR
jgi:hypothetical protein